MPVILQSQEKKDRTTKKSLDITIIYWQIQYNDDQMATTLRKFNITSWYNHPLHHKGRIRITLNRSSHDQFYMLESKKIKIKTTVVMEWSTTTKWCVSSSGRWLNACNQQPSRSTVEALSPDDGKLSIAPWKHQKVKIWSV